MMDMFYRLHKEKELTTVLVTHSMEDALKYADQVIILYKGKKYMEGKPAEVFAQKEELQRVQLDVPEIIQFLSSFEEKFGQSIPFRNQSIEEIAQSMVAALKGAETK